MKTHIIGFLAISCLFSEAAVTVDDSTDFAALGSTSITTTTDSVVFASANAGNGGDQGAGVTIDTSDTLTPTVGENLYFQFSTTYTGLEIDLFYGQVTTGIASADARRSDQNAFSVGINTSGDIFARENGNNVLLFTDINPAMGLDVGTEVQFDVVVTVNSGIKFEYDVTASYFDGSAIVTETITDISGNQNGANNVSNYDFHAVGTQGLAIGESYDVNGFTASDMPIPIPEPSALIMLAAGSLLMFRKRRA